MITFFKSISPDAYFGLIGVILGAFLGSGLTWINNALYNNGKTYFYLKKFSESFTKNDPSVGLCAAESLDDAQFYRFNLEFELYNSSREERLLRDFKICFRHNEKVLYEIVPKDDSTLRTIQKLSIYNELQAFTLKPREIATIIVHEGLNSKKYDLSNFNICNNVILVYKDEREHDHKCIVVENYRLSLEGNSDT